MANKTASTPPAPRRECVISDLSGASPAAALSGTPLQDRWLAVPYVGEISGTMLWSPVRNNPPDIAIPLPALGLCEIRVGLYASGTWPWWFNLIGRYGGQKAYNRLHLKLSDENWFDLMVPEDYPEIPRFEYVSECLWKTALLTGQSLVLAPPRQEAFLEATVSVAYVRLVPVEKKETWPKETRKLTAYFDCNFFGHYVASPADVRAKIEPLRESDFGTILWTASREDTCYYPSKVGNPLPPSSPNGVYPYWAGSDMARMLAAGEDPLRVVCETAHACGLKVFSSYRRMTCRMPPFVFPLHPDAMFEKRHDLWCADKTGAPVPHLSLAYPEVRARMVAILAEQAETYDIDGVHLFFCRSVPFVYYESPFLEAFAGRFGLDARTLPQTDERIWEVRADFMLSLLRELRAALDRAGQKRNRRFEIALHVMNSVRICRFYGLDTRGMIGEKLVDLLLPAACAFLPPEMGNGACTAETVAEFAALVRGSGTRLCPECSDNRGALKGEMGRLASAFYAAGAEGLHVDGAASGVRTSWEVQRRLGHPDELDRTEERSRHAGRAVRITRVRGFTLDLETGIPTCG